MTKEELKQKAIENVRNRFSICKNRNDDFILDNFGAEVEALVQFAEPREKRIEELKQQIEKLIDFVLSKTECCDVCPITDTCLNGDGTCHYTGILAKGEEEVTREWLMQKIAKEIKENV